MWAGFLTSLSLHNLPYEMMKIIPISQGIEGTMQELEVTKVTGIRLDAWDKRSDLVHWEDLEEAGGEGGGRGDWDGEHL